MLDYPTLIRRLPWTGVLLAFAVAAGARYGLIEPADNGHLCDGGSGPWWCTLRWAAIMSFTFHWLSTIALASGVAATFLRWRWLAILACIAGTAGMVLYEYVNSLAGLMLGLLVLVREPARRSASASVSANASAK